MTINIVGAVLGNSPERKPLVLLSKVVSCDFKGDKLALFIEETLDDFSSEHSKGGPDEQFIWGYSTKSSMDELKAGFQRYYDFREYERIEHFWDACELTHDKIRKYGKTAEEYAIRKRLISERNRRNRIMSVPV